MSYTQVASVTAMNTFPQTTAFHLRLCAVEEATNGVLRLPVFLTASTPALALINPALDVGMLSWMPLDDGLRLGLPDDSHHALRARLYHLAARRLPALLHARMPGDETIPVVDLDLPCLDRRTSTARQAHWSEATGETEASGFPRTMAAGWLAASRGETDLPPLAWSFDQQLNGACARALLTPLLEAYGACDPLPEWPASAFFHARYDVTLHGSAAASWYGLGPERAYDFFKHLSRISTGIQSAVRRWLPILWAGDGALFHHPREAVALLAYSSLPPLLARSRRCYTYDALDAASLKHALSYATRRIQRQLQLWYPALASLGHPIAEQLHPRWHSKWAAELSQRPKRLCTLLANEAWLIDQYVNFAAGFHEHATLSELTGVVRRARTMHATLDARFRRWWDGRQAQVLNGLVLLEAASALSPEPVRLTITLRRKDAAGSSMAPIVLRASRGAAAPDEDAQNHTAA